MNFEKALKRPFLDFKTLVIGSVLFMIPLVNIITGLFSAGYILNIGKLSMKKDYSLPEWSNWGELFVKGLLSAVIGFIYAIPVIIIALLFFGTSFFAAMFGKPTALIAFSGFGIVIVLLLELLLAFILPVALLRFMDHDSFGAAFGFGEVFSKAFTGKYFVAWILTIVVAIVVGLIASLLSLLLAITIVGPMIVMGFAVFIIGIIAYTLLGEAYG